MPVVIDDLGTREVSDAELRELNERAAIEWDEFWASLAWQPVSQYDYQEEPWVLVRRGPEWAFGYHGIGDTREAMWRNGQDCMDGLPLVFEPTEFAAVGDDMIARLASD